MTHPDKHRSPYRCRVCNEDVILRQVSGHVLTSYRHARRGDCTAMVTHFSLGMQPLDILGEEAVYTVPASPDDDPCDCGPRKSCPECTKNPNPICPCGAWYNFTCYCTEAELKAFQAGRRFESRLLKFCSSSGVY